MLERFLVGVIPNINFAGIVVDCNFSAPSGSILYRWGDLTDISLTAECVVISDISSNYPADTPTCLLGEVPIRAGENCILFPRIFENATYNRLCGLDETFLTECAQTSTGGVDFNLMRCGARLPTSQIRRVDAEILGKINKLTGISFNHIQTNKNPNRFAATCCDSGNSFMAICTFYETLDIPDVDQVGYDYMYNFSGRTGKKQKYFPNPSILLKIRVGAETISLYPGSLLLVSESAEILPISAPISLQSLNYIFRQSNKLAHWEDGDTYIEGADGVYRPMLHSETPNPADLMRPLKTHDF